MAVYYNCSCEKHGDLHTLPPAAYICPKTRTVESLHVSQLPLPQIHPLDRKLLPCSTQLEFVVDNETVASLLNMEIKVTNDFYESVVSRLDSGAHEK